MIKATQALQNASQVVPANDIRDIRPPVVITDAWVWVWWTLLVLAVAAVGVLAARLWLCRRAQPLIIPVIPPHERARRKLEAALDLFDQPKPFCILVSDAVRLYLEERFELQAPERTTEEFLQELKGNAQLSRAHKDVLERFLTACDFVKFARHQAGRAELEGLYAAALRLIEETMPEPAASGSGIPAAKEMAASR